MVLLVKDLAVGLILKCFGLALNSILSKNPETLICIDAVRYVALNKLSANAGGRYVIM